MRTLSITSGIAALVLLLPAAPAARANPVYSGTITGTFTAPTLTGSYLDAGGNPVFLDNTATAVYMISNNGANTTLTEGDNNGGSGAPSIIQFTGSSFSGVTPGEVFELGTITYQNGTSAFTSLLFGATLNLSVNGNPEISPASSAVGIVTTANSGVASLDADYLQFNSLGIAFHVYENAGATATVYGQIVGDPVLQMTDLQLPSDQSGGGFISPIPEPSVHALMVAGGAVLWLGFRHRRSSLLRAASHCATTG